MVVGIVNFGLGNIKSIERMLQRGGHAVKILSNADELFTVEKLILPGVGHFDEGVKQLKNRGMFNPLIQILNREKTPILGICLGMHLLCSSSEEGVSQGLGLVEAKCKKFQKNKFSQNLKIPHMGWNSVEISKESPIMNHGDLDLRYYFVHSYFVEPLDKSLILAQSSHGIKFCAAFQKGHIFGVQFHPEKSHKFGLNLFDKFMKWSK